MKKLNNVVLIDASKATISLNHQILSSMNFAEKVHTFTSSKQALEYIKNCIHEDCLPEVIFLDLVMPEMSGFEFLEAYINILDSKSANFEPVIIIVSDYLDFENFSKSKHYKTYGVLDHLRKPIDQSDVENLLEEYFS